MDTASSPRSPRRFKARPLLYVLAALLVVAGAGYWYWTQTPQYSLWQAVRAYQHHDLTRFEQYVDVDTVVDDFLDDTLPQLMNRALGQHNDDSPLAKLGQTLLKSFTASVKPVAGGLIKKQIREAVENGDFEKSSGHSHGPSLDDLRDKAHEKGIKYRRISYVRRDGNIVLVGVEFVSTKNGDNPFTVELKMREVDGYWKVVKCNNAGDVLVALGATLATQQ
jgi:hypothetical protein